LEAAILNRFTSGIPIDNAGGAATVINHRLQLCQDRIRRRNMKLSTS
jgi:hypothetical protein